MEEEKGRQWKENINGFSNVKSQSIQIHELPTFEPESLFSRKLLICLSFELFQISPFQWLFKKKICTYFFLKSRSSPNGPFGRIFFLFTPHWNQIEFDFYNYNFFWNFSLLGFLFLKSQYSHPRAHLSGHV